MIRPLATSEEPEVHAIHAACHPTFPPRPARWFEAHPTLVCEVDGVIVGYTSYSLVMYPEVSREGEVMVGYGIDIAPGRHGHGLGRALCDERLALARALGAKAFLGHAAPDNHAMLRLFERDGFKPYGEAAYPDGTPMLIFMGPVA